MVDPTRDPDDDALTEGPEPKPPSADDVARRALILSVVCCRGILELDPDQDAAQRFWNRVSPWWDAQGLASGLEAAEAVLLASPFGTAPRQNALNASWRAEALGVLAWALHRSDAVAHDRQVDPQSVATALGLLSDRTVLESPRLRSAEEIDDYAKVALTVHWRLREWTLRHEGLDFAKFCETAWFGPLSLRGVRLIDGDLAVGDVPITRAGAEDIRMVMSIAMERHLAANWLLDASRPFSDTDTST